jgi:beta-barrel assembly-enhancing protease
LTHARGRHPRPRVSAALRTALRKLSVSCAAILLLASATASLAASAIDLPDLGDPADAEFSPAQEARLGRAIEQNIRTQLPLVDDVQLNSYIQALGERLAANAPEPHIPFTFLIARDTSINAFAAPGGVIVVYSGLIEAAHSESELAAVMAHEIAHITQRHIARTLEQNQRMSLATMLAVLSGIVLSANAPQIGNAVTAGAVAGSLQNQLNFSRAFEREADSIGIDILGRAGYRPIAMADFFARLARSESPSDAGVPELLRTHPVTGDRIAEAEARAAQQPNTGRNDTLTFELAKARLQALLTPPRTIIEAYTKATSQVRAQPEVRYRYALALRRAGHARQSLAILQTLVARHPNSIAMRLALAISTSDSGQPDAALKQLRRLDKLYPQQEPIVVELARLEMKHGQADAALQHLRGLVETRSVQPETLHLEAQAAAQAGRPAFSHEALALYHFRLGNRTAALEQIELALHTPGLGTVEETRLRSLRRQIQRHTP